MTTYAIISLVMGLLFTVVLYIICKARVKGWQVPVFILVALVLMSALWPVAVFRLAYISVLKPKKNNNETIPEMSTTTPKPQENE